MAVIYTISHRKNVLKADKPSQYFAKIVQNNTVDLDTICKEIEKESTLSAADIYATAVALQGKIMQHLADGDCVNLDFLGRFSLGAKAKAQETKEEVSAKDFLKLHINYQPSLKTKKWLKQPFSFKKK